MYFDFLNRSNTNKNAIIDSRIDKTGKARTETQRRDPRSPKLAISTDERTNSTTLFIDFPVENGEVTTYGPVVDATVRLNGRQARSLYRLLKKHYRFTGKRR